MASRENQSLQIFVIALLILSLLLIGGLVWVNSNRKAAVARAEQAVSERDEANRLQRQLQEEANRYKQWMGSSEADSSDTIEKTFNEDVERWMSTFEKQNYRDALDVMYKENRKLIISEGDAKAKSKNLDAKLQQVEKQKDQQIKKYSDELQKVKSDLAAERSKFDTQYREVSSKNREIASQLDEQRVRFDEMVAANRSEKTELQGLIKKLERTIQVMQNEIPDPDPFAQPADGIVRWVNQRTRTVWINLGEADGLRPQVTFTIFSSEEPDALIAEQKATIEVTRILSAHMAEARVTSDIDTNPILAGDKIYSQVWNRGQRVSFAITGVIDMNGNGRHDLEQLKRVIEVNNGIIDAFPGRNGTVEGEITARTRYLILGDFPDKPQHKQLLQSWRVMTKEADTFGIEPIQLAEFLQLIGWKQEGNSVELGPGAAAKDFPAEKVDPSEYRPGKGNDIFRPRKRQLPY